MGLVPVACLTSFTPAVPLVALCQPHRPPTVPQHDKYVLPQGLCTSARDPLPINSLMATALASLMSLVKWQLCERSTLTPYLILQSILGTLPWFSFFPTLIIAFSHST